MAAFPITGEPSPRTSVSADTGKRTVLTMGGALRGTNLFAKTYFDITRVDEYLTQAEVDSVWAQHDSFPDLEHTMTVNGQSYTFEYIGRPVITEYFGIYRTLQTKARGYL